MDWAEDLKFTLKKSAKKGRRAAQNFISTTATSSSSTAISTADKPNNGSSTSTSSTRTEAAVLKAAGRRDEDLFDEDDPLSDDNEAATVLKSKKVGGWADEAIKFGTNKKNTNLIEQERFNSITSTTNYSDDDIPIIPDLDDMQDDLILNEVVEAPTVTINRAATYKELNSDLLKHGVFASLEHFDLSILSRCLQHESAITEPDSVWSWEQLFIEVSAEINSDKPHSADVAPTQFIN